MRLVSLNVWGGRIFEPLMRFIEESSGDTDIFCFQEVFRNDRGISELTEQYHPNLFAEMGRRLPDHEGFFAMYEVGHSYEAPVEHLEFGLALFVKRQIPVAGHGKVWVSHNGETENFRDRNMQFAQLQAGGRDLVIGNVHGIWIKDVGKVDRPVRIEQSERINEQLEKMPGEQILCGDFNLNPDTDSLKLLERGRRNLIKEFGIESTRTKYYQKPGKFADYTLVSPGISVDSFEVPDEPVSDHRPMVLDFDLS